MNVSLKDGLGKLFSQELVGEILFPENWFDEILLAKNWLWNSHFPRIDGKNRLSRESIAKIVFRGNPLREIVFPEN